jgi:hypothetical protein
MDYLIIILDKQVSMVASSLLGRELVPAVHDVSHFDAIYVFRVNEVAAAEEQESWIEDHTQRVRVRINAHPASRQLVLLQIHLTYTDNFIRSSVLFYSLELRFDSKLLKEYLLFDHCIKFVL